MRNIVVFTRHQVTTTEIEPLQLREPAGKLLFNMYECAFQHIGTTFAMTMAMEPFYVGRQLVRQLVGSNAKTGTWGAGVIEHRAHLGVLGINAQPDGTLPSPFVEPLVLRERVKGEVAGTAHHLIELSIGIRRRIGMSLRAKLLKRKTGFRQRTGRSGMDILSEDGERLPKGKGLEGQDNLYIGFTGNTGYECQIAT